MDDYALVLNAGSSSLKFCVFRRPESARSGGSKGGDRLKESAPHHISKLRMPKVAR